MRKEKEKVGWTENLFQIALRLMVGFYYILSLFSRIVCDVIMQTILILKLMQKWFFYVQ